MCPEFRAAFLQIGINQYTDDDTIICRHDVIIDFLDVAGFFAKVKILHRLSIFDTFISSLILYCDQKIDKPFEKEKKNNSYKQTLGARICDLNVALN